MAGTYPGANLDAPPPSPATDPQAAQETGQPPPGGLVGPLPPSGPDLSGLQSMGDKLVKGCLLLAQAAPDAAAYFSQASSLIQAGMKQINIGAGAGDPDAMAKPTGLVLPGPGNQFPGSQTSRPF